MDVCRALQEIKVPLRVFWDSEKMKKSGKKKRHANSDEEVQAGNDPSAAKRDRDFDSDNNPDAMGQVLHDPLFWAFLDMLLIVSHVSTALLAWFNSCPCHACKAMQKMCKAPHLVAATEKGALVQRRATPARECRACPLGLACISPSRCCRAAGRR